MKFMVFEGTTEEFKETAPLMGLKSKAAEDSHPVSHHTHMGSEEISELSLGVVKLVFTRLPLADKVKTMFRLIYKSGTDRVTSDDIKEAVDFNSNQFRGMMGAFGRRLANTPGVPKGARLFDEEWDHELGQKTWALPPNVRTALEQLRLV